MIDCLDTPTIVALCRGLEKIVIDIGAIITIYLGYRLYRLGIDKGTSQVTFEPTFLNLPLGKFICSGTGPGLVFMLIGAAILCVSLYIQTVTKVTTPSDKKIELPFNKPGSKGNLSSNNTPKEPSL